jgi:hypothetical protein
LDKILAILAPAPAMQEKKVSETVSEPLAADDQPITEKETNKVVKKKAKVTKKSVATEIPSTE